MDLSFKVRGESSGDFDRSSGAEIYHLSISNICKENLTLSLYVENLVSKLSAIYYDLFSKKIRNFQFCGLQKTLIIESHRMSLECHDT